MQTLILTTLISWALWTTFGTLLPKSQRKLRGRLARLAEGRLPARWVQWLRPAFPSTGCGCGSGCADPSDQASKKPPG